MGSSRYIRAAPDLVSGTREGSHFYKKNWSEPQHNTNRKTKVTIHKAEGNLNANKALTLALGLRSDARPNWSCCHIWGVDDPTFQLSNGVVSDHRFYSCVANMLLLPTPLKVFTDTVPEVKAMLRICAGSFDGWRCDHADVASLHALLDEWVDWSAWPDGWPRPGQRSTPLGVMPFTAGVDGSRDVASPARRIF